MKKFCLMVFLVLSISFNASATDDFKEIWIGAGSSVGALKTILNDWEYLNDAMVRYASTSEELVGCDLESLSIEHIVNVGVVSKDSVIGGLPATRSLSGQGLSLQFVVTQNPCDLSAKKRFITWHFYKYSNGYNVFGLMKPNF